MLKPPAFIMAVCLSLALAACASKPEPSAPQFSFTKAPPYRVAATYVNVENAYAAPPPLPSVENAERATPADIARAWARDRLQANGSTGKVVLRILEARVTEESIETKHGVAGYFAGEQNRQFVARLKVEVLLYGGPQQVGPGRVNAEATATRPLAAKADPKDAQAAYYAVVEQLSHDFDGAISQQMSSYLGQN